MESVCVSSMKCFVATNINIEDSERKPLFSVDWPYLRGKKDPDWTLP